MRMICNILFARALLFKKAGKLYFSFTEESGAGSLVQVRLPAQGAISALALLLLLRTVACITSDWQCND